MYYVISTHLEKEGIRRPTKVDVGRKAPFMLRQNAGHLQDDKSGLNGGLAGVVHRLVPRGAGQLEGDDNRHRSLIVG